MKQTCKTCLAHFDNGTSGIHGCDTIVLLRQFRDAFGRLRERDVEALRDDAAVDLLSLYVRVRSMLADLDEATPSGEDGGA